MVNAKLVCWKMVNWTLACWLIVSLMIPAVFAQSRIALTLDVYRNDSVVLLDVHAEPGQFDEEKTGTGYTVSLERNGVEWQTHVPISFTLWDAIPPLKERETVTAYLPYPGNKGRIMLSKNDTLLWSFELANLCNSDAKCERPENALSCRADCQRAATDALCLPLVDGFCDPDCAPDIDTDCLPVLGKLTREDLARLQWILGSLLVVVIALGVYLALRRQHS